MTFGISRWGRFSSRCCHHVWAKLLIADCGNNRLLLMDRAVAVG
ncbi:MAG: hypothetical protein ACLPUO_23595 [Streptosporangiaceae bacterium]